MGNRSEAPRSAQEVSDFTLPAMRIYWLGAGFDEALVVSGPESLKGSDWDMLQNKLQSVNVSTQGFRRGNNRTYQYLVAFQLLGAAHLLASREHERHSTLQLRPSSHKAPHLKGRAFRISSRTSGICAMEHKY